MASHFQYPKPLRLPIGKGVEGKEYMGNKDAKYLFSGRVIVEEKMDGRPLFVELERFILCLEDLKRRHSIKYRVPGRYALFDVYEKNSGLFLTRDSKLQVWNDILKGRITVPKKYHTPIIFPVSLVKVGIIALDDVPGLIRTSHYALNDDGSSGLMEGVVVKPDRPLYPMEFLTGKLVRSEFTEGIIENYIRQPPTPNIIDPTTTLRLKY